MFTSLNCHVWINTFDLVLTGFQRDFRLGQCYCAIFVYYAIPGKCPNFGVLHVFTQISEVYIDYFWGYRFITLLTKWWNLYDDLSLDYEMKKVSCIRQIYTSGIPYRHTMLSMKRWFFSFLITLVSTEKHDVSAIIRA